MAKVFLGYEHVLDRTLEIAERCNVRLEKVHDPFPQFEVPDRLFTSPTTSSTSRARALPSA